MCALVSGTWRDGVDGSHRHQKRVLILAPMPFSSFAIESFLFYFT